MRRLLSTALVSLLATVPGTACEQTIGSCIPGTPGCVCDGSNSCEPGVVCVDNQCIPLDHGPPVADGGSTGFDTGFDTELGTGGGSTTGVLERDAAGAT